MFRAVVFDFNGVLVDDEPIHFELFQLVLGEEGLGLSAEEYYEQYLGFDDRDCFEAVLRRSGVETSLPRVLRLVARKAAYYQQRIRAQGYPFFPGSIELVREVAGAGLTLGLVSGALREEVLGALSQEGLADLFKSLVTAEDVERGKPDSEGYRRVLAELNSQPPFPERLLHPHEVVAIEDSPAGLEAAADAGLRTLGVAHTYPPVALKGADAVVPHLRGLALRRLEQLFEDSARAVT
jgi:HAD superfamily hydrolase (TIGR01509 family)